MCAGIKVALIAWSLLRSVCQIVYLFLFCFVHGVTPSPLRHRVVSEARATCDPIAPTSFLRIPHKAGRSAGMGFPSRLGG
jgi:hypothetical protein